MSWLKGWRKRVQAVVRKPEEDRALEEELAFHLDMETAKHIREGLPPEEARRRANLSFGGVVKYGEATKDARALGWLSGLSLDFRLGVRMLVRYPGLTIVGGLSIAFAICLGAVMFEFLTQVFHPRLPLPGGDRIVSIVQWDVKANEPESRMLSDYNAWRGQLQTFDDVGALRGFQRNLLIDGTAGEQVSGAEVTASVFRITGVSPLQGRTILEADERADAPPVAVIGYGLWQSRFSGADVIGRSVRIGMEDVAIVGVMPDGFGFPSTADVWLPLRTNLLTRGILEGPTVEVVGRLSAGSSFRAAQEELSNYSAGLAASYPATHRNLQAKVYKYGDPMLMFGLTEAGVDRIMRMVPFSLNALIGLVVVLVCSNVALLMFARAAAREGEIVVRNALGASRRRITLQLFAEALVLGVLGAMVGIAAAGIALRGAFALVEINVMKGPLPFWMNPRISPPTILYSCGLTLLGAGIAGVIPGLKVTRGLGARMRESAGGGGGFRFGGVWTAVIVGQIALTIPLPMLVIAVRYERKAVAAVRVPVASQQYLTARLDGTRNDPSAGPDSVWFPSVLLDLEQRLEADPLVRGVTFTDVLPRMYHPHHFAELDGGPAAEQNPAYPGYRISSVAIAPDYFDVLGVTVAGRDFSAGDVGSEARPIIVNHSFVQRVLGGGSAIGRRVRLLEYPEEADDRTQMVPGPWHEVVGIVPDLGNAYGNDLKNAGIYRPVAPGTERTRMIAVHMAGSVSAAVPRLRTLAVAADPTLRVSDVLRLDRVDDAELRFYDIWTAIVLSTTAVVLLLSLAGIYSIMSFTVSQRTREIGIRVALGGSRLRVLQAIFRRPMRQLGLGIFTGGAAFVALLFLGDGEMSLKGLGLLAAYLAVMTLVCSTAWIVPTRRALAVQPIEALRIDG